ncbi:ATP-binding protein [Thioalkalivibrio sp.]|uniref:ATP-binding protein n=1 Tax=Thioalkalivibrio sp. TaxID=2093813 RepID=UPI00356B4AB1
MILIESLGPARESVVKLFEELYDPALLIDPEKGVFVGANSAACEFLGYSPEELAALSPTEIHPHEIPRLDAFLFAVREQGRWKADDLSCRTKLGHLVPAQVRATLVHISDREYVLSVVHDRREAELAELGRSIRKLTHDLRNTMVSSRLMSDRLRRHEDPLVRQSADLIARSVDRAVRMCQQTLEVGSAREGSPRRERFMLSDLMAELNAAIGPREVARAEMESPNAEEIELDADFDQVFRILTNLIRNAIAAGSRHIRVIGSREGNRTVIDCEDDGPGLPDSLQGCLFAEKGTGRGTGGAGLGLAIAWELARNHGGDLIMRETGPTGTVFRLLLPDRPGVPEVPGDAVL